MTVKVTRPGIPAPRPAGSYPHLSGIQDTATAAAIRLIYDHLLTLGVRVDDLDALGVQHGNRLNTLQTGVQAATEGAQAAQMLVAKVVSSAPNSSPPVGGGGVGPDPDSPGTDISWDGGQGAAGMGAAGATGHVSPSAPKTLYTVGQIVGGTANEFVSLLAPVATEDDRRANLAQLLVRIIWHVNLAGFTAGNNRNPSSAVGIDNFTVYIEGVVRGYDIFSSGTFHNIDQAGSVMMLPLQPQETGYIANGGLAD